MKNFIRLYGEDFAELGIAVVFLVIIAVSGVFTIRHRETELAAKAKATTASDRSPMLSSMAGLPVKTPPAKRGPKE